MRGSTVSENVVANNNHLEESIMAYVEFFRERQQARYAVGKGRFRGCG